jgi:hypothetical protein
MLPRRHLACAIACFALAMGFTVRAVHYHAPHIGHAPHTEHEDSATHLHGVAHAPGESGHHHADHCSAPSEIPKHSHSDPFAPNHDGDHHQCHFCMILGQVAENPTVSASFLSALQLSNDQSVIASPSINRFYFPDSRFLRGPPETLLS